MKTLEEIEDHKEAAAILDAEYAALGWHNAIHGGYLSVDESGWSHYAFQIGFWPPAKAKEAVFFDWKNGMAHVTKDRYGKTLGPKKPNPAEVLGRVCADYLSIAQESFSDWSAAYGYDEDSRKAYRIYEDCQALGPKLRRLGLSRAQIQRFGALANML